MRYSEIDLQIEDIMWFAIDINGYVLAFTSGGCGNVPEFVCNSKEETTILSDFFMNSLNKTTNANLLIDNDGSYLAEDSIELSSKGIFCFDVFIDDNNNCNYSKIASPSEPILFSSLPQNIKNIISSHNINIDVLHTDTVTVKHAY